MNNRFYIRVLETHEIEMLSKDDKNQLINFISNHLKELNFDCGIAKSYYRDGEYSKTLRLRTVCNYWARRLQIYKCLVSESVRNSIFYNTHCHHFHVIYSKSKLSKYRPDQLHRILVFLKEVHKFQILEYEPYACIKVNYYLKRIRRDEE